MFIQALESRRSFTSVTYTGALVIDGTEGDDAINVGVKGATFVAVMELFNGGAASAAWVLNQGAFNLQRWRMAAGDS